jgi:hypothetical protein
MTDTLLCHVCKEIRTTGVDENGQPLCANCSNEQYFRDLRNGDRVELKIDMRKVRRSTLLQIQALIQRDMEEATPSHTPSPE